MIGGVSYIPSHTGSRVWETLEARSRLIHISAWFFFHTFMFLFKLVKSVYCTIWLRIQDFLVLFFPHFPSNGFRAAPRPRYDCSLPLATFLFKWCSALLPAALHSAGLLSPLIHALDARLVYFDFNTPCSFYHLCCAALQTHIEVLLCFHSGCLCLFSIWTWGYLKSTNKQWSQCIHLNMLFIFVIHIGLTICSLWQRNKRT